MTLMDQIHPNPIFEENKRPTESSILAGSATPGVANIWYYLRWSQWQMQCKDNQAHRELVRKQRILLLSCYAVTKSTLLLMFICFMILIIEDAPIEANQPCAKGTFPQLRGTGRGIKRHILQRFVASVHGPFCRWSVGLLAVEKVESWRTKKKQTLSPWYFNDASIESIGILIVFWKVLECFGLFSIAVGKGSCFNELDGCGSWQANVVTSLLLQKLKWIKSSKTSSTSQQEKTEHLHAFKGGGFPSYVRFYFKRSHKVHLCQKDLNKVYKHLRTVLFSTFF